MCLASALGSNLCLHKALWFVIVLNLPLEHSKVSCADGMCVWQLVVGVRYSQLVARSVVVKFCRFHVCKESFHEGRGRFSRVPGHVAKLLVSCKPLSSCCTSGIASVEMPKGRIWQACNR